MHELADTVWISYKVFQEILTENLNMRRIATKFVPQLLTNDQKQRCINMRLELREKANEYSTFISRIIRGDESWIYSYGPKTKQQTSQWKSPQSPSAKTARQVRSSTKSMLIVFFFDVKGIDVLRRLTENVRRKRPELWCNHNWLVHHDNVPAHTPLKTTEFVTNNMVIIPHPLYLPDLAPCDFALFPKLKMKLKG
jgi:histone-lysine N-methyltransferase SETMAR